MTPKRKARSGPTIPEDRRKAVQVKLRLSPDDAAALAALARHRGVTSSALVADLVAEAERQPEREYRHNAANVAAWKEAWRKLQAVPVEGATLARKDR